MQNQFGMYDPNLWNPNLIPQLQQQPVQTPVVPQPKAVEVIRVNGEEGAKAYQLPPNSSVLLLDITQPAVWLKTTDGAGYPTVSGYKIEPMEKESTKQVAISDDKYSALEERVLKLERRLKNNGSPKSNVAEPSK